MGSSCSSTNSRFELTIKSSLKSTSSKRLGLGGDMQCRRSRAFSMTSSSEVEVQVSKPPEVQNEQPTPESTPGPSDGLMEETNSLIPVLSTDMMTVSNTGSSTTLINLPSQHGSPTADDKSVRKDPQWRMPSHLASLAPEMQNLLMGFDPGPLPLSPRVIKLYIAADDTDTLAERMVLTKTVFPRLRVFCEEHGYHLQIVDLHWPLPSGIDKQIQIGHMAKSAMCNDVTLWLVILSNKLGWTLPLSIPAAQFDDICSRLPGEDMKKLFHECYFLDENSLPPAYIGVQTPTMDRKLLQELCDVLWDIMTDEEKDLYMAPCLHEEIIKALNSRNRMSDNIVVVLRDFHHLPEGASSKDNIESLDPMLSTNNNINEVERNQRSAKLLSGLKSRIEQEVHVDFILKCTASLEAKDSVGLATMECENDFLCSLSERLEMKLQTALKTVFDDKRQQDIFTAAGMPTALSHELCLHAYKRHQLCSRVDQVSPTVSMAISHIQSFPRSPLILHGCLGCGLDTVAAQLASEMAVSRSAVVALRFLGLTPDAQNLSAAMFSILEQTSIALGGPGMKQLKSLSCDALLTSIARCAADHPVAIILSGLQLTMLDEQGWQPPKNLPENLHLVILTSDNSLLDTWSNGLDSKCFMELKSVGLAELKTIFHRELQVSRRCVTPQQEAAVVAAMEKCPRPFFAVALATMAKRWTSRTCITENELPSSVEDAVQQVLLELESSIGKECVARVLTYLTIARCGLSDSEMDDLLAIDDSVVLSMYPQEVPAVCRCPQAVWFHLKTTLAPWLDDICLQGHSVSQWSQQSVATVVTHRYLDHTGPPALAALHATLADFFQGRWANKPKLFPDPNAEVEVLHHRYVLPQPDEYTANHSNSRKFLCLLYHLLHSQKQEQLNTTAEHHILNVDRLVKKLEATSTGQVLQDLHIAVVRIPSLAEDIKWLMMVLAQNAKELSVSVKQLYNYLHKEIEKNEGTGTQKLNIAEKIKAACACPPSLVLSLQDSPASLINTLEGNNSAECGIDGLYLLAADSPFLVSISELAGEVVVWDTSHHEPIRILRGLDKPRDLALVDAHHVLVLCNRELRLLNLNTGAQVTRLPGLLNLNMPFFCMGDASTVIVLSRNRMSVNVLDLFTGQIRATFKAGEDRFLNSLLVSADGGTLVCGDETQKPSPLLVWDLRECKLQHDLRLPQHEFATNIADITDDGAYAACACKELSSPSPTFVVVYELSSGQLFKRFKMAASVTCIKMASPTLSLIMLLDDSSLASFSLTSGNCNFHACGVKAIYNQVKLSPDAAMAVTYSSKTCITPTTSTVALWNIMEGKFLGSYTFDTGVMCCQLMPHTNSVMVGLASHQGYVALTFQSSPQNTGKTNVTEDAFGDPLMKGKVFVISSP